MKQTAVEWYAEEAMRLEIKKAKGNISVYQMLNELSNVLNQAKEMEKEQSKKMYEYAAWAMFYNGHGETFDEYWNKNFIR